MSVTNDGTDDGEILPDHRDTAYAMAERERAEHGTEVFMVTEAHIFAGSSIVELYTEGEHDEEAIESAREAIGKWCWWSCQPGCLPDSDPHGPFDSETEAIADMRDQYDLAPIAWVENIDGDCVDEEGTFVDGYDESGNVRTDVELRVVVYTDAADAYRMGSICGGTWENLEDGDCYDIIMVPNSEVVGDEVIRVVNAEGWAIRTLW